MLEVLGGFGERVDHDDKDSTNNRDGAIIPKESNNDERNNDIDNLKGITQKVIFKQIDEIQSSLSKPSPSTKGEAHWVKQYHQPDNVIGRHQYMFRVSLLCK